MPASLNRPDRRRRLVPAPSGDPHLLLDPARSLATEVRLIAKCSIRPLRAPGRPLCVALALVALLPRLASAQQAEPIGPFAVDVRGSLARYGEDLLVASHLGVAPTDLPGSGFGLSAGAHWYPLRLGAVTLGIGAEWFTSRGRRTPTDEAGDVIGPAVETRLDSLAPQVSFNFGTGRGWSYISGGISQARFTSRVESTTGEDPRVKAINYGGGARWFATRHLAFTFDLRFYAINPQPATDSTPARSRTTLMAFNAGVSVK